MSGNRFVADLDRHATRRRDQLVVKYGGIEPAAGDSLGEFRGRDPQRGGRVGLAASELPRPNFSLVNVPAPSPAISNWGTPLRSTIETVTL
jgi:hypothetical protein